MCFRKVAFFAVQLPAIALYFTGVPIIMSPPSNSSCIYRLKCEETSWWILCSCLAAAEWKVWRHLIKEEWLIYILWWFLLSDILSWNDRCVRSQKHAQGGVLHTRTEVRVKGSQNIEIFHFTVFKRFSLLTAKLPTHLWSLLCVCDTRVVGCFPEGDILNVACDFTSKTSEKTKLLFVRQ